MANEINSTKSQSEILQLILQKLQNLEGQFKLLQDENKTVLADNKKLREELLTRKSDKAKTRGETRGNPVNVSDNGVLFVEDMTVKQLK